MIQAKVAIRMRARRAKGIMSIGGSDRWPQAQDGNVCRIRRERRMDEDDLLVTITVEPPEGSFQQLTGLGEEQTLDVIAHTLAHVGVETPVEVGVLIST